MSLKAIESSQISEMAMLPSSRGHSEIPYVVVDFALRDLEGSTISNGVPTKYSINIIIYRPPGVDREKVEPHIKMTLEEVFQGQTGCIDVVWRDELKIAQGIGALKDASGNKSLRFMQANDNWLIEVLPPRAYLYSNLPEFARYFLSVLNRRLA